jgi:hypothetical protein
VNCVSDVRGTYRLHHCVTPRSTPRCVATATIEIIFQSAGEHPCSVHTDSLDSEIPENVNGTTSIYQRWYITNYEQGKYSVKNCCDSNVLEQYRDKKIVGWCCILFIRKKVQ